MLNEIERKLKQTKPSLSRAELAVLVTIELEMRRSNFLIHLLAQLPRKTLVGAVAQLLYERCGMTRNPSTVVVRAVGALRKQN